VAADLLLKLTMGSPNETDKVSLDSDSVRYPPTSLISTRAGSSSATTQTTRGAEPSESSEAQHVVQEDDVPDGGYGWVIVVACATVTFFFVG
jgi:hypothetical protein